MPLNKTKGNMYDFITHTWNPIKGACPHQCSYCYMDKIYKRFGKTPAPPHLDEKELRTNLGSGNFIFVGSSCDMFANDIPLEWTTCVLDKIRLHGGSNQYLLQTKNPQRLLYYILRGDIHPLHYTLVTTLESNIDYGTIRGKAPYIEERVAAMEKMKGYNKMVTIEPVLDFNTLDFVSLIKQCAPIQVNIGADTGHNHLPEPPPEKVRELIAELEKFTKVVCKKNLGRLLK